MFNSKSLRWIGLIGAICSAVPLIANGQINEAVAIVFAAFSSAGVVGDRG